VALREQGELARAIDTLQRALALHPSFAEGWLELGNAHMHAEQLPEASTAYERAIALEATLSEAHANLALAYQEQDLPEDAITAYHAVGGGMNRPFSRDESPRSEPSSGKRLIPKVRDAQRARVIPSIPRLTSWGTQGEKSPRGSVFLQTPRGLSRGRKH
jgi:Tfp pilus assembly protein PilF